jgi:carbon storage regulator
MLVLSRKKGESIMIGNDIELTVLSVEGETVRLGIAAPRAVSIYRREIYDQIQKENREAIVVSLNIDELNEFKNKKSEKNQEK